MADLNIRDVDDEVKSITEELARRESLSTSAYIRQLLESNAQAERRRRAMWAADRRLTHVRDQWRVDRGESLGSVVRELRVEHEQHDEHP